MVNKSYNTKDVNRLEKTFFSKRQKKDTLIISNKIKKTLIIANILIILSIIIVLLNFNVFLVPVNNAGLKNSADLLNNKNLALPELIGSNTDSKILKNSVYLSILPNKKDGFSINFNEKSNLNDSKVIAIVKKPIQALTLSIVLRDKNFLSNANTPLQVEIAPIIGTARYMEIPISISNETISSVNLSNIKQIRFLFSNNGLEAASVSVKNIFLKKGGSN